MAEVVFFCNISGNSATLNTQRLCLPLVVMWNDYESSFCLGIYISQYLDHPEFRYDCIHTALIMVIKASSVSLQLASFHCTISFRWALHSSRYMNSSSQPLFTWRPTSRFSLFALAGGAAAWLSSSYITSSRAILSSTHSESLYV